MPVSRSARYETLSRLLASSDDAELAALLATGQRASIGIGGESATVDVAGIPVFVKRIPLTDLELAHPHSTANLFGLPTFGQYGIAGPSFNAWRELAANTAVTELVLAGETELFPLLYHWRVLPGRAPVAAEHVDTEAVVAALDGHPAVRTRLEALVDATSSLVLFFEYLPIPIDSWLAKDPSGKAEAFEQQLSEIVTSLQSRELLHMDGHFANLRTDGTRIYLTDFGLATSPRFDLSAAERDFAERHATHDANYAAMRLVNWIATKLCGFNELAGGAPVARNEFVARCAAGEIPSDLPANIAAILNRHAPAAAMMNSFYWKLFDGDVHARYPGL